MMDELPAENPDPEEDLMVTMNGVEIVPEKNDLEENSPQVPVSSSVASARHSRRVALISIYAALILALDYLPGRPPNVEFMTCLLFIAGYCFGSRIGGLIALVVSAIFSYLNPLGPSQPTLFAFQVGFYVCVALSGSLCARYRQHRPFVLGGRSAAILGVFGFCVTLAFDIGSTFSFGLPLTNWNWAAVWPIWYSGLVFTIIHVVANTIIFAFLAPVVINAIHAQYGSMFEDKGKNNLSTTR
jgi:uncharacterized membrane protein